RLEWLLRKLGIEHLVVAGIVTNGGVASTVRDAHVRDLDVTVLEDGCAAPTPAMHAEAIAALKPVARIATIAAVLAEVEAL
uniref:cysteine hydrolase family protein n=1 Tax=Bosea sp. (in: a-proteobacteria) TaxID=1871050 RepID=UPI003B39FB39